MVVKVYISGISGNKEVKKRQQRVLLILDSKNIKYDVIDIAEPGSEEQKDFMQNNSTSLGETIGDPNPRHPLPPQIFNDDVYCGDYDQFDMANEIDEMEKFLKLEIADSTLKSEGKSKMENGSLHVDSEMEGPNEVVEETKNVLSNGEQDIVEEAHTENENIQES
ncbi:SH3 domain-binding glutamic acid-rich protein homolog [Coccinella septempunctata]|uniref:SH3 domain-binding glutamic acid-rich protein homolog n=1 Tax=Coccinella septempunctata TaxID=41139 RepID=UPI001D07956B|nr:SH3 domain-binding glutamic acid-rich protein homolog [Coccinella septempunctata]